MSTNSISGAFEEKAINSMSLMDDNTNEDNLEAMRELIEYHWYLTPDSEEKVLQAIDRENWPLPALPPGLQLNKQNRLSIPLEMRPEFDVAYDIYYSRISQEWAQGKIPDEEAKELLNYSTFQEGKFQGQKLFKYIKNKGYATQATLEIITDKRITGTVYVLISKNPVDILFSSTNQNFATCQDLNSGHSGAYYMGLPHYMADPNVFLVALTPGKIKNYTVKDLKLKHFGLLSRSFAILTELDALQFIKFYPRELTDYKEILQEYNIKSENPDTGFRSKYPATTLYFDSDEVIGHNTLCRPYFDKQRIDAEGRYTYNSVGASCDMQHFNWSEGFEEIPSLEEAITGGDMVCHMCGFVGDEMAMVDDGILCGDCVTRNYTQCGACRDLVHEDDAVITDVDNYCPECSVEFTAQCEDCGDTVHRDDIVTTVEENEICEHCFETDSGIYCESCRLPSTEWGEVVTELGGENWCQSCINSTTAECPTCGEHVVAGDQVQAEAICCGADTDSPPRFYITRRSRVSGPDVEIKVKKSHKLYATGENSLRAVIGPLETQEMAESALEEINLHYPGFLYGLKMARFYGWQRIGYQNIQETVTDEKDWKPTLLIDIFYLLAYRSFRDDFPDSISLDTFRLETIRRPSVRHTREDQLSQLVSQINDIAGKYGLSLGDSEAQKVAKYYMIDAVNGDQGDVDLNEKINGGPDAYYIIRMDPETDSFFNVLSQSEIENRPRISDSTRAVIGPFIAPQAADEIMDKLRSYYQRNIGWVESVGLLKENFSIGLTVYEKIQKNIYGSEWTPGFLIDVFYIMASEQDSIVPARLRAKAVIESDVLETIMSEISDWIEGLLHRTYGMDVRREDVEAVAIAYVQDIREQRITIDMARPIHAAETGTDQEETENNYVVLDAGDQVAVMPWTEDLNYKNAGPLRPIFDGRPREEAERIKRIIDQEESMAEAYLELESQEYISFPEDRYWNVQIRKSGDPGWKPRYVKDLYYILSQEAYHLPSDVAPDGLEELTKQQAFEKIEIVTGWLRGYIQTRTGDTPDEALLRQATVAYMTDFYGSFTFRIQETLTEPVTYG